ncbi:MAG: ATP-binding cassette domain-containing protein, partial [Rhizobium rhizophilum]
MRMKISDLSRQFGTTKAVDSVTLDIPTGQMVGVIGRSGAGKSTLFKGIVGALKPLSGRVDLNGLSERDVAYLPQAAE